MTGGGVHRHRAGAAGGAADANGSRVELPSRGGKQADGLRVSSQSGTKAVDAFARLPSSVNVHSPVGRIGHFGRLKLVGPQPIVHLQEGRVAIRCYGGINSPVFGIASHY